MPYALRPGLVFCRMGNQLVFADIDQDRYFRLSPRFERAIISEIEGLPIDRATLEELVTEGILAPSTRSALREIPPDVPTPTRSVVEDYLDDPKRSSVRSFILVTTSTLVARRNLKRKSLRYNLTRMAQYRARRCAELKPSSARPERNIIRETCTFLHARRHIASPGSCLPDSIALVNFLSRRRLHANLVIGVTSQPFSAHSWVQSGSLALNEAVSIAASHTPILVV